MYVIGTLFVEGGARFALVAGFSFRSGVHAVDGLGEDTGAGGLTHATRTAEQIGVCQFSGGDGVFQGGGQGALAYYRFKSRGTVLPCRYDIIFHIQGVLVTNPGAKIAQAAFALCKCTQKKEIFQLFLLSLYAKKPFKLLIDYMDKLASLWLLVRKNKYWITLILFAVLIVFVDENSMIRRAGYKREESRLREEIEKYRSDYEENTRRLNELAVDSGAIERIAREKYLMKKPNEDIYVFEEDVE